MAIKGLSTVTPKCFHVGFSSHVVASALQVNIFGSASLPQATGDLAGPHAQQEEQLASEECSPLHPHTYTAVEDISSATTEVSIPVVTLQDQFDSLIDGLVTLASFPAPPPPVRL